LWALLPSLGIVFWTASVWAGLFAQEGAQGVLEIDVTVEGAGLEQSPNDAERHRWSVKHTGTYRLAMIAKSAIVNGEVSGGAANDGDDTDSDAYWQQKTDACKGDIVCETEVAMEQMQSPEVLAEMQQLGDEMYAAQQAGPGVAANAQSWHVASRSGSVRIEQHDDVLDTISERGGRVDVLCTNTFEGALDPKPQRELGPMAPAIIIDGDSSRYTLQLSVEESFTLKRVCTSEGDTWEEPQSRASILLGGSPVEEGGWSRHLRVEGSYTGEPAAPSFEGTKTIQAGALGASNRKATVTIAWRFRPGRS
jgi:hypothetical protein